MCPCGGDGVCPCGGGGVCPCGVHGALLHITPLAAQLRAAPRVDTEPGIRPDVCVDYKEHLSMSRIAKGLVLTSAAVAAVAGGAGVATADAGAGGVAAHSPGVVSGNEVQVPVHVPINVCGDTVDIIGLLNPAFGDTCVND
ncbi:hypothetical protein ACE1SV_22910 [Streptomyces sp. E-15]